ncbi:hypothetical protein [Aquimarina pacifica]|uniref:hypothetical protein n=1 Tax=Aquimarina pacifica TaxID=1296415 RepID=UPI0004B855F6|nr:hypothetical protein [Aquimarina pacifica]
MKKNQKGNTGKKLNLEKLQISKITNPEEIIGGKKPPISDNNVTIYWTEILR